MKIDMSENTRAAFADLAKNEIVTADTLVAMAELNNSILDRARLFKKATPSAHRMIDGVDISSEGCVAIRIISDTYTYNHGKTIMIPATDFASDDALAAYTAQYELDRKEADVTRAMEASERKRKLEATERGTLLHLLQKYGDVVNG